MPEKKPTPKELVDTMNGVVKIKLTPSQVNRLLRAEAELQRLQALYQGPLVQIDEAQSRATAELKKILDAHETPVQRLDTHEWKSEEDGDDFVLIGTPRDAD